MGKPKGRRAFTLVELMVVLVIIGLFAGMTVPNITTAIRRGSLDSTAEKISETLCFASSCAIAHHRAMIITIDTNNKRLWLTQQVTRLPWRKDEEETEKPATISRSLAYVQIPKQLQLTLTFQDDSGERRNSEEGKETLVFDSQGRSGNALIELADAQGGRIAVEVNGSSGMARVRKGAADATMQTL